MKKALTTAGVALALGLFAGVATTAHAADNLTDKSDVNFEVTIDESKAGLQLTSVPSFNFGKIGQNDLISGTQTLKGFATDPLEVTDYTGNHAGWNVTGQLGPFTNNGDTLDADSLTLNGADAKVTAEDIEGATLASANLKAGETALTAAANTGAGKTTAEFATTTADAVTAGGNAATLGLPKHTTTKAGEYKATIDWTLGTAAAIPADGDTTDTNS